MAFRNLKHLPRSTASDKILCDKAINISKTPTYDGFQTGLTSMVYKFFDKNGSNGGVRRADESSIKNKNIPDEQLAKELYKPFIGKLE